MTNYLVLRAHAELCGKREPLPPVEDALAELVAEALRLKANAGAVRELDRIRLAHDFLQQTTLDRERYRQIVEPGEGARVVASLEALCWVLKHEHSKALSDLLATLSTRLMGYEPPAANIDRDNTSTIK